MVKLRHGHASGHVRDTFCEAVEAWVSWNPNAEPEPTVEYEIQYVPHQIPISRACGLVWNCTDIMPGDLYYLLRGEGLDIKRSTYAACARAMHQDIARHT